MNRKKKFSAVSIALWFLSGICTAEAQILPYPESPVVTGISFDFSTHERHALGSDNWPVTWANDNHQYTSWGDGGGFGGTNTDGRVSLGVARVEGDATSYVGINVWGGKNSLYPATFGGKSYGILALGNTLYMWVSPGSNTQNYEEARLYRSTDGGASWSGASWAFSKNDGLILPTFLQFGKGYQGARDEFVYIYANHLKDSSSLKVQKPGEIALIRVHKNSIMDRSAYQFFSGFDGGGNPLWTNDIKNRVPVFMDPNGVGWNVSVSYNKGLNRYFLITEHETSMRGKMGVFDAPEPWGAMDNGSVYEQFWFSSY